MSNVTARLILLTALIVQLIGFCALLLIDFSGPISEIAFWAVIGAGIVEVVLGLRSRRQKDALNG